MLSALWFRLPLSLVFARVLERIGRRKQSLQIVPMQLLVGENGQPLIYCTLRFRLDQARNANTPDDENQSIIPHRVFLCGLAVFRIWLYLKYTSSARALMLP